MNLIVKLSAVALLGAACAACSNTQQAPTASAPATSSEAPAASAIPLQAPSGSSSATPAPPPMTNGPSLAVILQRPSFAKAFADMDGASALPAWAKGGNNSAPSARVQVEGKTMWLSHVCQAGDCQWQLFLLTDPAQHAMQGLLVESSGDAGDSVRKLIWLGKPDAATQTYLKDQAARG